MGWCRARQRLRVRRVHARRGDMGANYVLVMPSRPEGLPSPPMWLTMRKLSRTALPVFWPMLQLRIVWQPRSSASGPGAPKPKRSEWRPLSEYANLSGLSPRGCFLGSSRRSFGWRFDSESSRDFTKCPNYRECLCGKKRAVQCK